MKSLIKEKGFTLIELLVVIAVIGVLAGVLFVAIDPSGQIDKATENRVHRELGELARIVQFAQVNEGKSILQITNHGCSDCGCRGDATGASCLATMEESWSEIYTAAGSTFTKTPTDPWGTPYMYDENETEGAGNCTKDSLRSWGPSKIYGGDNINYKNQVYNIPHSWSPDC